MKIKENIGYDNFITKYKYCGRPILWSNEEWFACSSKKGVSNDTRIRFNK